MSRPFEPIQALCDMAERELKCRAILPWPPSTNRIWRAVPGKGVIKSAEYRNWLELAKLAIHGQSLNRIKGKFIVLIAADRPDNRHRDLDNIAKPILDALAGSGVIENDSLAQVINLSWTHREARKPGSVAVTLLPIREV